MKKVIIRIAYELPTISFSFASGGIRGNLGLLRAILNSSCQTM